MLKYAVCGVILCAAICGVYYLGYSAGSNERQIEYVTKEVEVVRYVDRKKENIYTRPNDDFAAIYKRMREQR